MNNEFYTSCSELPIFNFYQILDDGKLEYMVKGYDGGDFDEVIASMIFQQILEEYTELTENRKVIQNVRMQLEIKSLEFEKDVLQKTLDLFNEFGDDYIFEPIAEFGFIKSESESYDNFVSRIVSRIKSLNNKIRINKERYSKKFKKEEKAIKRNLEKEALILEINLKLGREIDVKTTSVTKWVNLINISKEQSEQLKKLTENGKV